MTELTFNEYSAERIAAQGETRSFEQRLAAGGLGLSGESGEVAEIIKKVLFHGKEMDRDKLIKELGDVLWYINYTADTIGSSLAEVAHINNQKLRERYPNGWNLEDAAKRPLREDGV